MRYILHRQTKVLKFVLTCNVFCRALLVGNIESLKFISASSPVFSLLCMYTEFAGRVLSHLVLQRIFRRMPMEEPPLQMQSQVPTSMPSIQRTHAVHAILNLFNPFLYVVFNIFWGSSLDHELRIQVFQMSCNCMQLFLPVWLWAPITPRMIWYYKWNMFCLFCKLFGFSSLILL